MRVNKLFIFVGGRFITCDKWLLKKGPNNFISRSLLKLLELSDNEIHR
jgi:hypothetical protein